MDRSQAYQTLNLHQSADGAMVADAYWRMVRIAQSEGDTAEARASIERLNQAYAALNPKTAPPRPQVQGGQAALQQMEGSGVWVLDVFADWLVEQARRTRARWPGRNLEIGLIGGASLVLLLLAVGSGASLLFSFPNALVVLAAIWAPLRSPE